MNVEAVQVLVEEAKPVSLPEPLPHTDVQPGAQEAGGAGETGGTGESGTGKVVRPRHLHPIYLSEYVAESGRQLTGLEGASPPLRQLLTELGIVPACTMLCASQREAVLATMEARQQSVATERDAVYVQDRAIATARGSLSALRQVQRTLFTGDGAQVALGLNEELPWADEQFVDRGRILLAVAQREPYSTVLAGAAFSAERIAEIGVEIDVAAQTIAARLEARNAAVLTTRVRDEAFAELRRLMRQLRVQVHNVLRRHPELERPVGF